MTENERPKNDAQEDAGKSATPADEAAEKSAAPDGSDPHAEISALNDRILRLAAELENTRRRAEREKADASRFAIASFARDLLNVADTFERALQAAPSEGEDVSAETVTALVSGLKMTDKELLTVLERHGVRKVSPKGEKFDPNLHQAVSQAPGDAPANHVLEVIQPGFVIGERVLRAAMVVVSTGASAAGAEEKPPLVKEEEPSEPGSRLDRRA